MAKWHYRYRLFRLLKSASFFPCRGLSGQRIYSDVVREAIIVNELLFGPWR